VSSAAGPAAQKLATQLAEDFGLLGLSQEMFFVGCFRTGGVARTSVWGNIGWDIVRSLLDFIGIIMGSTHLEPPVKKNRPHAAL